MRENFAYADASAPPAAERLIRLADVPSLPWLPLRSGKRLSLPTVYRWAQRGLRGVKLRTVRVGSCQCTSEAWLWDFFNRLSNPAGGAGEGRPPTPRQREDAIDNADRALERAWQTSRSTR